MKPFNLDEALAGKPVFTRDGKEVKQLHLFDAPKEKDALYGLEGDYIESWNKLGQYRTNGAESGHDLFMAPTERKEWIVRTPVLVDMLVNGNHYSNNIFGPYDDYEIAKKTADTLKGTIHEITINE